MDSTHEAEIGHSTLKVTAGLLAVEVDPEISWDGRYVTEKRLAEIERRILLIEAAQGASHD